MDDGGVLRRQLRHRDAAVQIAQGFVLKKRFLSWLPILLIASVAIFLRVYAMERLPPGLFSDEAVEGLDALDVLAGNFAIWFHAGLGREPLFVYLVALSYRVFGVTPLATRLPALMAGLATIPATFFLVREWATGAFPQSPRQRVERLALLTTALLAISFWHIQMSRNAHRDILLPLVETAGYALLWRALRTGSWKMYAGAGAVLGLAIYTYSPGRFVGVFVATFFAIEFFIARFGRRVGENIAAIQVQWRGLAAAAIFAIMVMLPLGIYFTQNPVQFGRRFESVSIFNADVPVAALASSLSGNLAMFGIPGAGYESKHYNLPGRPVFDFFLLPWFLAGVLIAVVRSKNPPYRFLLLWFLVMMAPAFLTADMIPKGVRSLGTMPGVLIFIAVAMDALLEWVGARHAVPLQKRAVNVLIALTFVGSAIWTTYDYFVSWANLPELPIAFDSDYVEISDYIQDLMPTENVYVSAEVYRHPTLMLLGKRIPTTQYFDRATRIKEFDATHTLVTSDSNDIAIFVRDQSPPEDWYRRLAPQNVQIATGKFFAAYRLRELAPPQRTVDESFNPFLKLVGYSRYLDDPRGIVLYWQIAALPDDRAEMQSKVTLMDARGQGIAQAEQRLGYPPMEWGTGETIVEWFAFDVPESALSDSNPFVIQLSRGDANWKAQIFQK